MICAMDGTAKHTTAAQSHAALIAIRCREVPAMVMLFLAFGRWRRRRCLCWSRWNRRRRCRGDGGRGSRRGGLGLTGDMRLTAVRQSLLRHDFQRAFYRNLYNLGLLINPAVRTQPRVFLIVKCLKVNRGIWLETRQR